MVIIRINENNIGKSTMNSSNDHPHPSHWQFCLLRTLSVSSVRNTPPSNISRKENLNIKLQCPGDFLPSGTSGFRGFSDVTRNLWSSSIFQFSFPLRWQHPPKGSPHDGKGSRGALQTQASEFLISEGERSLFLSIHTSPWERSLSGSSGVLYPLIPI